MQFLVVLVVIAVLLRIGDASIVDSSLAAISQQAQQSAQNILNDRQEAIVNMIAEQFPEVDKAAMHKRRLLGAYTSYFGYFQASVYLTTAGRTTCNGGEPATAAGFGYGCMPFPGVSCTGDFPCSFGTTCSSVDDGIRIAGDIYSSSDCSGPIYTGPGAAEMATQLNNLPYHPKCINGMKYSCVAAGGPPASLYDGYRSTNYDSSVCMGQPMSYTDGYNLQSSQLKYFCADGWVKMQTQFSAHDIHQVTCASQSSGISTAWGCVSAMPSTSERTFTTFQMSQTINGVSSTVWNGSSKNANIIVLATSLAAALGVDYDAISGLVVTGAGTGAGTNAVTATYTLKVQPGFGNSYTASNLYASLTAKAASSTAPSCTTGCFLKLLKANAKSASLSSIASGVTSVSYQASATTTPKTITQTSPATPPDGPAPDGPGSANSNSPSSSSSGANTAAAVIGVLLILGCIGVYYYTRIYKPKLLRDAAAQSGLAPPPQVAIDKAPTYSGATASAPPPPAYPQI